MDKCTAYSRQAQDCAHQLPLKVGVAKAKVLAVDDEWKSCGKIPALTVFAF